MGYLVAGLVIALGVTMVIAGVSGSGKDLFSAVTGRSIVNGGGTAPVGTAGTTTPGAPSVTPTLNTGPLGGV